MCNAVKFCVILCKIVCMQYSHILDIKYPTSLEHEPRHPKKRLMTPQNNLYLYGVHFFYNFADSYITNFILQLITINYRYLSSNLAI